MAPAPARTGPLLSEAAATGRGPGIYVASPLGFSDPGRRYLESVLHPALVAEGFTPLDPWAAGREVVASRTPEMSDETVNSMLGAKNIALINACDAVLAVLDGSDVDSGTAAEIGYACGIGKLVVGLRTDFRLAGENLAAPVNLQVISFLDTSGGALARSLPEAIEDLVARLGSEVLAPRILHLADVAEWRAAGSDGYRRSTRDQSLEEVGFIHCSYPDQVLASAERFYRDVDPSSLVLLVIDPSRLESPLVVEAASSGEEFPHIHGPLNTDAVVACRSVARENDSFVFGEPRPR